MSTLFPTAIPSVEATGIVLTPLATSAVSGVALFSTWSPER